MELIKDKEFGGERPLFATHDLRLENITIVDGESGIKQCQRMEAYDCKFYGKYPWWHVDGAYIDNCYFAEGSRSAIWYTNDMPPRIFAIELTVVGLHPLTLFDARLAVSDGDVLQAQVVCGEQRPLASELLVFD